MSVLWLHVPNHGCVAAIRTVLPGVADRPIVAAFRGECHENGDKARRVATGRERSGLKRTRAAYLGGDEKDRSARRQIEAGEASSPAKVYR